MIRRSAKKVEEAEAAVAKAEAEVADIEAKISAGVTDGDIFTRHQTAVREVETAMSLWELAEQEHSELLERFGR